MTRTQRRESACGEAETATFTAPGSGLPPLYIQSATAETLLSDSTRLASRVRDAGGSVELHVAPGLWHDSPALAPLFPEANQALRAAATFIASNTGR